jgi:hypothetical protein
MMKRKLGHAIAAKTYWSQCRQLLLLAITHNVMILLRWVIEVFYGACQIHFALVICTDKRSQVITVSIYIVLALTLLTPVYAMYLNAQTNKSILYGFWIWWGAVLSVHLSSVVLLSGPPVRDGCCVKCGYDLRGSLHSRECPECGETIALDIQKEASPKDLS